MKSKVLTWEEFPVIDKFSLLSSSVFCRVCTNDTWQTWIFYSSKINTDFQCWKVNFPSKMFFFFSNTYFLLILFKLGSIWLSIGKILFSITVLMMIVFSIKRLNKLCEWILIFRIKIFDQLYKYSHWIFIDF